MDAKKKIVLVRNSVDGKGLELAKTLLKENISVMINGPEQEKIIECLNKLAHEYCADLLYGVPGNIMSPQEFAKFYGNPQIAEVVSAE